MVLDRGKYLNWVMVVLYRLLVSYNRYNCGRPVVLGLTKNNKNEVSLSRIVICVVHECNKHSLVHIQAYMN